MESDLPSLDDPDLRALVVLADPRKELPIVADDNHAALKLLDRVRERVNGLHVEVIGGLVQEQNVRLAELDGGEDDAGLIMQGQNPSGHF